ncbi:MAG: hypothetical protein M3Z64_12055 [Verrucomicrobiota bacterium]|nr:hypothetical protein [Verrucomicrobiota bacterium]
MKKAVRIVAPVLLAFGLVAGCKTVANVAKLTTFETKGDKYYAVVNDSAAFYRRGPQQGNGPDTQLPKDTIVTLIRPSFGYSKVQLLNGSQQGYVASEDIRVAPPALVAQATATPPPVAVVTPPRGEHFDLNSNDPRLQPPPELLPAPDLPPADLPVAGSPPPTP